MNAELVTKTITPPSALKSLEAWLYNLINAGLIGGGTALSAWASLALSRAAGLDVPELNWKAIGTIFIANALLKMAFFVSKGLPQIFPPEQAVDNPPPKP